MTRRLLRGGGFVAALVAALLCGACSDDSGTTTTPAPTSPVTETFSGIVFPTGTVSRAFSMTTAGAINVTLVSAGPPATIVMRIGVGVPFSSLGCSLVQVVDTAPSAAAQLSLSADVGDYCVSILDVGNAPKTGASFLINVVHP